MSDTRRKNIQWTLPDALTFDAAHLAVLMDIRDELQTLNGLLGCARCVNIPRVLDTIAANTRKPKRRRPARTNGRGG